MFRKLTLLLFIVILPAAQKPGAPQTATRPETQPAPESRAGKLIQDLAGSVVIDTASPDWQIRLPRLKLIIHRSENNINILEFTIGDDTTLDSLESLFPNGGWIRVGGRDWEPVERKKWLGTSELAALRFRLLIKSMESLGISVKYKIDDRGNCEELWNVAGSRKSAEDYSNKFGNPNVCNLWRVEGGSILADSRLGVEDLWRDMLLFWRQLPVDEAHARPDQVIAGPILQIATLAGGKHQSRVQVEVLEKDAEPDQIHMQVRARWKDSEACAAGAAAFESSIRAVSDDQSFTIRPRDLTRFERGLNYDYICDSSSLRPRKITFWDWHRFDFSLKTQSDNTFRNYQFEWLTGGQR